MYAIIKTGGSQFKVEPDMEFDINRLAGEPGETLTLDEQVLMLKTDSETHMGTPTVAGAAVDLEIVNHFRGKKIIVFKMKRRKRYRRKQGHRQELTRVRVRDIRLPGGASAVETEAEAKPVDAPQTEPTEPLAAETA